MRQVAHQRQMDRLSRSRHGPSGSVSLCHPPAAFSHVQNPKDCPKSGDWELLGAVVACSTKTSSCCSALAKSMRLFGPVDSAPILHRRRDQELQLWAAVRIDPTSCAPRVRKCRPEHWGSYVFSRNTPFLWVFKRNEQKTTLFCLFFILYFFWGRGFPIQKTRHTDGFPSHKSAQQASSPCIDNPKQVFV